MMDEDDVHDKLVKAYLEYFKANEIFEQRPSEPKRRVVRKWLQEIRHYAKLRRVEVIESHLNKQERYKRGGKQKQDKGEGV
jgi:hypothetical protein